MVIDGRRSGVLSRYCFLAGSQFCSLLPPAERHGDYHLASTALLRHQIISQVLIRGTQLRTTWAGTGSTLAEAELNLSERRQIRDVHLPLAAQHEDDEHDDDDESS